MKIPARHARRLTLSGHVQGVGFRPFVYRLAHDLGLRGWVKNVTGRVEIHAEGEEAGLAAFARDLIAKAPPLARPQLLASAPAEPEGSTGFRILESSATAEADIHLPADNFVCPDCLAEMEAPGNRRHRYAFTNCTQCGPRYTLIRALPYDRANTAMAGFPLCPDCRAEYEDPMDRRFHAEPIACPVCGPHLEYVEGEHRVRGDDEAALAAVVAALKAGKIVAVKGIGGYHLMVDARNETAVQTLRARKPRPAKPLAVLFPDLDSLRHQAEIPPEAEALLVSPARPILLLPRRATADLAANIAPGLAEIGCFLAYSPLHHLLLRDFGGPLVATSGNISGEPVLTDNAEATERLARIADAFLHHDRPIVRPADDAVFRPSAGRPRPLRLGRGTAPLELQLPSPLAEPVLALGSHMKNTLCLAWRDRAVLSPHIGELDSERSLATLIQVAEDLQRIYQVRADRLLLDRHPGYGYRRWARESGLPLGEVWHHHAHASALAWEFPAVADWIVFAWDGVGLGEDGSLWGGEALVGGPGCWQRRASLRPFRLPGADKAGREPWRSAAALLWEDALGAEGSACDVGLPDPVTLPLSRREKEQLPLLHRAWQQGINCPASSAAGRLFDAAAALAGICSQASFEGEGPMRLEALAISSLQHVREPSPLELDSRLRGNAAPILPLARDDKGLWRSDWAPLLPILTDTSASQGERAWHFHAALARALTDQAQRLRDETGIGDVGLTGGVFQNRLLTELALAMLEQAGFRVHLAERVPVNDAGVSFGQVIEFLHS